MHSAPAPFRHARHVPAPVRNLLVGILFLASVLRAGEGVPPPGATTASASGSAITGANEAPLAAAAAGSSDADRDGLPDDFERLHGLDPASALDAAGDPDGDGLSTLQEYLAGTDPRSAASALRLTGLAPVPVGTGWRVAWTSVAGRTYALQRWDGRAFAAPGAPLWIDVGQVTAGGSESAWVDALPGTAALYRVRAESPGDPSNPGGPTLWDLQATPSPVEAEGWVTLSVRASDPRGVAEVAFRDGAEAIATATRVEGDRWRAHWPVTRAWNGLRALTAVAANASGSRSTSAPVALSVAIPQPLLTFVVGGLTLRSEAFATNGNALGTGATLILGKVVLTQVHDLMRYPLRNALGGLARIAVPDFGILHDGAFEVDAGTGVLGLIRPFNGRLAEVALTPRCTLAPDTLDIQTATAALSGTGAARLTIPGFADGPARLEGSYVQDPVPFTLAVRGRVTLGALLGTNLLATVRLADSTLVISGDLTLPAGSGGPALALRDARIELRFDAGGRPILDVTGTRTGDGTAFTGELQGDGSVRAGTPTPEFVARRPDLFVPLGPDGEPREGGVVQARADGTLAAFEYRPAGRHLLGARGGFGLRFPGGARFLDGATPQLEFVEVSAGFGADSPVQFPERLVRTAGAARRLAIGPLDLPTLAAVFDRPAELPVAVFRRIPFLWKAGTLTDGGIQDAWLAPVETGIPLPRRASGQPGTGLGVHLDFARTGGLEIQLPLFGELALSDAEGQPIRVGIPEANPAWLTLRSDGHVKLEGRGRAELPHGVRFDVEILLDDPVYRLGLAAAGLHFNLLDGLGDLLPASACSLPGTSPAPTAAAIANAATCRARLDQAYFTFAAAMTDAQGTNAAGRTVAVPGPRTVVNAALDAWAWVALSRSGAITQLDRLQELLRQTRRAAVASRDLGGVLRHRVAFENALRVLRLRQALGTDTTPSTAEVQALLDEIHAAALDRASRPDAVESLAQFREALGALLEAERLAQSVGEDPPARAPIQRPELLAVMRALVAAFTARQSDDLRIRTGVFRAASGEPLAVLDRHALYARFRDVVEVLASAQQLGLDGSLDARFANELVRQLAAALEGHVVAALNRAEADRDLQAFTVAVAELLYLQAQGALFASDADLVNRLAAAQSDLAARLGRVAESDPTFRAAPTSAMLASRLSHLTRFLVGLPQSAAFLTPPTQLALELLDQNLARVLPGLAGIAGQPDALQQLARILEAGTRGVAARDHFNLPGAATWETADMAAVITRLIDAAIARQGWFDLHDAVGLLLEQATRLASGAPLRARVYLEQADRLLAAAHQVALAVRTQARQGQGPLALADMLLPGEVVVEKVSGSLEFNLRTREIAGAFSGDLGLPQFAGRLAIHNASFATGGRLDLAASGKLVFPSAEEPRLELGVLPRHPLHVSLERGGRFGLSGSARVAVNGIFFEGFLSLEDPEYGIGIATGGYRIDLPEKLFGYLPALDADRVRALPATARGIAAEYLHELGSSLETLSDLDAPEFQPVGSPPDFAESEFDISTAPLSAAVGGITLVLAAPAALGIQTVVPAITNLVGQVDLELDRLRRDLRRAETDFRSAAAAGRSRAARVLAKAIADFALALDRVNKATSAIRQAQGEGRVPLEPQFLPSAQADPATTCAQLKSLVELLAADAALANTPEEVAAILGSFEHYRTLAVNLGCPNISLPDAQADEFARRATRGSLGAYGMDENGNIVNPGVFAGLSEAKLEEASRTVVGIGIAAQLTGTDARFHSTYQRALAAIYSRRHELGAAEIRRIRSTPFPAAGRTNVEPLRVEALLPVQLRLFKLYAEMQTAGVGDIPLKAGSDGSTNATTAVADHQNLAVQLNSSLGQLAGALDASNPKYDRDFFAVYVKRISDGRVEALRAAELEALISRLRAGRRPDNPWRVPEAAFVGLKRDLSTLARFIHQSTVAWIGDQASVRFTLAQSVQLARHLMALARLLEASGRPDAAPGAPALHGGAAAGINDDLAREVGTRILPPFTARVTALARARQAWWVLTEISRSLAGGLADNVDHNAPIVAALGADAAAVTVAAADTLLRELLDLVRNNPVQLRLPGDLAIDRAFGELHFHRGTRVVQGSFGGRLRFPDSGFYVEVDHATLDSTGRFSFGGELGTPLPVGGVRVKAHVDVAGEARVVNRQVQGSLTSFTGTGTVFLPPLDGTDEIELSTSVAYASDRTLTLATLANDLDLRLSRHFQLFDVGGSLRFGDRLHGVLPLPGTGELVLQGGLGLFARVDNPTSPADYLLSGSQVRVRFRSRIDPANGRLNLELAVLEGELGLSEQFTTGACGGTATAGARPRIQIDPARPLVLQLVLKAPAPGQEPALESIVLNPGSLGLRELGALAPGIAGLGAEICEGTLDLPPLTLVPGAASLPALPSIHITRGVLRVPFPPGQTNQINLVDFHWGLDGLPRGTVELASNLVLLDLGGFRFEALGRDPANPNAPGTRLVVGQATGLQPPPLSLSGRVRFVVSPDVLQKEPTASDPTTEVGLVLQGTANLEWGKAPDLSGLFEGVSLEGSFRLGNGIGLRGFPAGNGQPATPARITLSNVRNIPAAVEGRALPDDQAFTVALTGLIQVPDGPGFGGRNLRFLFHNRPEGRPPNAPAGIPEFRPGTFEYRAEGWALAQSLPFQVSSATLALVDPARPLPWPQLLRPEHWQLTITAGLSLPSPERPVVSGQVYDWTVRFKNDGVPDMQLDAIQLGIANLSFPPIDNVGGTVHIGGLDDPRNLFFIGRVGGFIYGYGVDLVLGFNRSGPIGACVRGTLGNVGIPLGTTGFILNGASGGISFANSNADPCEIDGYVNPDGSLKKNDDWPLPAFPAPALSWDQLAQFLERYRQREEIYAVFRAPSGAAAAAPPPILPATYRPGSFADFSADPADPNVPPAPAPAPSGTAAQAPQMSKWETPCPDACPPPTVNIFCEPHPDRELYPNRVIAKFSSLDESELAAIGLTSDRVKSLWQQAGRRVDAFADLAAARLREAASQIAPRALDGLPKAAQINALIEGALDELRLAFATLLRDRLAPLALDQLTDEALWRHVAETAYRGAPCPDVTLKLAGQLGHFTGAVSGNAGVILGTAGTAGVVADINLVGVPVGRLDGYLAVTDQNGNFNPSLCGQLEIEVGPVDIGKIAASLVGTMSPDAARTFFTALGTCADARVLGPLARRIKADLVTANRSSSQILAQLDLTQQLALAGLLQTQPGLDGLIPCLRGALAEGWSQYNPELRACGEGQPRVMGIPTGPRLADLAAQGKKTSFFAAADASASGTLAYAATLASCTAAGAAAGAAVTVWIFGYGAIAGGIAGASVGLTVGAVAGGVTSTLFSVERGMVALEVETPDPVAGLVAAMSGKLATPAAIEKYGHDSLDLLLENATLGGRWSLVPLGFKIASTSARILMPEWNDHPNRPGIRWVTPGTGTRANWPSPASLLLDITRERVLPDPSWDGSTADLAELVTDPVRRQALVDGRAELGRDYFPYGGYLHGMDLMLPRALVSAVPQELRTAADPAANPLERFLGAMNYVEKYVMTTTNVGALAAYVPFPAPTVFQADGRTLAPRELLEQVTRFDVAPWVATLESAGVEAASRLYPAHLFFAEGYLDAALLGVPIANASLKLVPPDIRPPTRPPLFEVTAAVPSGSWLAEWVDRASLRFELTQAPPMPIEAWSTNVLAPLIAGARALTNAALTSAAADQERLRFVDQVVTSLATNLPKASLDAALENLHVPARLAQLIQVDPRGSARLRAFSPRFAPGETATTPLANARRNGGVVLQGSFTFGNLVSVPDAQIALLPNALSLLDPRSPPTLHARVENARLAGNPSGLAFAQASLELVADLSYPAPGSLQPKLRIDGRLASISLPPGSAAPLLDIRPLDGQPDLAVSLDLDLAGRQSLALAPAELRVRGPFASEARFRIHGATPASPFTYSATEPWTNRLTYSAATPLPALVLQGQPLVQLQAGDLSDLLLVRDATGVISVRARIRNGATLSFLPGSPLAGTRTLNAEGTLRLGTDGTFEVTGSAGTAWTFGGTTLPAGAFALRNDPASQTARLTCATATSLPLGLFTLEPLVAGTPLDAQLAIRYLPASAPAPARWDLALSLPPARLRLPVPATTPAPTLASSTTFQIDGGPDDRGQPRRFTLSNDPASETTARLQAENTLNLWVRNTSSVAGTPPGTEVLRFESATRPVGTLASRGQGTAQLRLALPAAGNLVLLPSLAPLRREFRVGPGSLEVSSSGTFLASGQCADVVSAGNYFTHALRWGVGTRFEISPARAVFGLDVASLDAITLPGLQLSGQATLEFALPAVQPTLNGTLAFDPVRLAVLEWLPAAGDNRLRGSLVHAAAGPTVLALQPSQIRVGGPSAPAVALAGITVAPDGAFERTFTLASLPVPVSGTAETHVLRNLAATFRRTAAGVFSASLNGELDAPSLRALFETTSPLVFSATTTGATLEFSSNFPGVTVGATDDFVLAGGSMRLSNAGLRLSGTTLRVQPVLGTARRAYLTFNLPEFALPAVVPAAGISPALAVGAFQLVAPAQAGGTALAPHALANGTFNLAWRPNVLSLENVAATLAAIPGFPAWANVAFRNGRVGPDGRLDLRAPALPAVAFGVLELQGVAPILSENGLRLAGADLQVGSLFRVDDRLADLAIPADSSGTFQWAVSSPPALTLAGMPFSRVPLALRRAPSAQEPGEPALHGAALVTSVTITNAELLVPGIPAFPFSGTIASDGTLDLAHRQPAPAPFLGFNVALTNTLSRTTTAPRDVVLADAPLAFWRLGDQYSFVSAFTRDTYRVRDETGRFPTTLPVPLKPDGLEVVQKEPGIVPEDSAFRFAAGQFIVVPANAAFDLRGPLSLEAWVKVRAWNRTWQTIVGKGDRTWQLHRLGDTRKVAFGTFRNNAWHDLAGTPDLDDGRWHHLVATYDGSVKRLYIDGRLDASSTEVSGPLATSTFNVAIGGSTEAADRAFDGWIDEVAIYSMALPEDRVESHYRAAVGGALTTRLAVVFNNQPFVGLAGSIAADGSVRARAALAQTGMGGFSWGPASFEFRRAGAVGNARLDAEATLVRPAAWLANLLAPWPTLRGSVGLNGATPWLDLAISNLPNAVVGFPVDALDLRYQGPLFPAASPAPALAVSNVRVSGYPILPAGTTLTGSLPNTGDLQLSRAGLAFGFGGFQATAGRVDLGRNGMTIRGDFAIKATVAGREIQFERDARAVTFSGAFNTSKQLVDGTLLGYFPLKLGPFVANAANYRLQSTGLGLGTGAHDLGFGALQVPFTVFQLGSAGLASFSGSKAATMSCPDCPFAPSASHTVTLSRANADGALSGNASGSASVRGPTVANGPSATYSAGISGPVGSDGRVTVNLPATLVRLERVANGCCCKPFTTERFDCDLWVPYSSLGLELW